MEPDKDVIPPLIPPYNRKKLVFIFSLLIILGFAAGIWLTTLQNIISVPQSVTRQLSFPIYLPRKLPGNYEINSRSFTVSESTFVFSASDGTNGRIAFTEQTRPSPDFDFTAFYKEQLVDARTLDNVPFPSVVGTTHEQTTFLSIVTPEVWIIANTSSPLQPDDMRLIAQHIQRYDPHN